MADNSTCWNISISANLAEAVPVEKSALYWWQIPYGRRSKFRPYFVYIAMGVMRRASRGSICCSCDLLKHDVGGLLIRILLLRLVVNAGVMSRNSFYCRPRTDRQQVQQASSTSCWLFSWCIREMNDSVRLTEVVIPFRPTVQTWFGQDFTEFDGPATGDMLKCFFPWASLLHAWRSLVETAPPHSRASHTMMMMMMMMIGGRQPLRRLCDRLSWLLSAFECMFICYHRIVDLYKLSFI